MEERSRAVDIPGCAVFVWWVFREAGAPELYYGGGETAYCPTLMSFHKESEGD